MAGIRLHSRFGNNIGRHVSLSSIQWDMLQRTVFIIKTGCYNEHRCCNERGGIQLADIEPACA
jgi:hypothetical protein